MHVWEVVRAILSARDAEPELPESAFPQNRNLVGAFVSTLATAARRGQLPCVGEVLYLRAARPADDAG